MLKYRIQMDQIPELLTAHGLTAEQGWDMSVYPKRGERLLCVVGGVKGKDGDYTPLLPILREDKPLLPYTCYLAQYLDGSETPVVLPARDLQQAQERARAPPPRNFLYRNIACTTNMAYAAVTEALDRMGLEGLRPGDITGDTVYLHTEAGGRRCNGRHHDSNNAIVKFKPDGQLHYYCFSQHCETWIPIGTYPMNIRMLIDMKRRSAAEMQRYSHMLVSSIMVQRRSLDDDEDSVLLSQIDHFLMEYHNR